jgi:sec-independent protein translocase protein TatA
MGLPNIGPLELIIILAVLLLVVGPRRLPEMGQAFGRTIREFRKASTEMTDAATISTDTKTVPTTLATPAAPAPAVPAPEASASADAAPALPATPAAALPEERVPAAPRQPGSQALDPGTDTTDDASRQA